MKKFILGFLCGAATILLVLSLMSKGSNSGSGANTRTGSETEAAAESVTSTASNSSIRRLRGVNMLAAPVDFTTSKKFKIMQVISEGALATCATYEYGFEMFNDPIVYIIADSENQFYDDQIIKVPSGKKAVQIGTYQYSNRLNVQKTVPVIEFQ